jgi:polyisoprenyl-phosphate glycosyltransferase
VTAPASAPASALGVGLTVVVPCLDEEDAVPVVHRAVMRELAEVADVELLYVDDGSTDGTLARIRELAASDSRVSFLSFTRNFGLEAAFSAGYRYARHPWVLHLDADLQFPAAEGRRLLATALQGYDAVFGVRAVRHDPWTRRWAARAYHTVARRLAIEMPPGGTTFRLLRADLARRVVDLELPMPYFIASVPRLTSRWTTVTVDHLPRVLGRSKFGHAALVRHALSLYLGFSRRPLRWAASMSLALAAVITAVTCAAVLGAPLPVPLLRALAGTALVSLLGTAAVSVAYLSVLHAGTQAFPRYLVRETNIAIAAADHLPPAARAGTVSTPVPSPVVVGTT